MIWRSTILSLLLAIGLGAAVFYVKYEVQEHERTLQNLTREILHTREALHVLAAEWSYLNQPARLKRLAEQYLNLRPVTAHQIITLDDLQAASPAVGEEPPASPSAPVPSADMKERVRPLASPVHEVRP
jgi:hypothetical protein